MHVTLYRGATNPTPLQVDEFDSWSEFADAFEDLLDVEAPSKTELLAFAPHRLREGSKRALSNVEAVTFLVVDVDRCNVDELVERLAAADIDAIMYGSPSDDADGDPDGRRVRIMAPMSRELTGTPEQINEACKRTRFALAEALGIEPGQGVEGAVDASKLFFVGRVEGTPARAFWRFEAAA